MAALSDFRLVVPYQEWKNHDWQGAIRKADGLIRRILEMQERAIHALSGVDLSPLTPEKLAWTVLWARAYVLLQATRDLYDVHGARAVGALERPALELQLQVDAIRRPWEILHAATKTESRVVVTDERLQGAWRAVADRLRGFAAWALTHDLLYHRHRLARWELRRVFRPTDPNDLPTSPSDQALDRYLWGASEIIGESEAANDRRNAEAMYRRTIERIESWLADENFGHWTSVELAGWIRGTAGSETLPTLFAVFDPAAASIRKYLRAQEAEELCAVYSKTSMYLHGSSILTFATIGFDRKEGVVVPDVLAPDADRNRICEFTADMCNAAILGLWGLRDKCLV